MKKIFLLILVLPLMVLAEDPFPTNRRAAEGESQTDALTDGPTTDGTIATHSKAGAGIQGACPMCSGPSLLNPSTPTNAPSGSSSSRPGTSPASGSGNTAE